MQLPDTGQTSKLMKLKINVDNGVATTVGQKFRGFEFENGSYSAKAYIDGYHIADRLLEGVIFEGEVLDSGELQVKVMKKHEEYLKQFNIDMHVRAALEYFIEIDFVMASPDGGEDVNLTRGDPVPAPEPKKGVVIKMTSAADILKGRQP